MVSPGQSFVPNPQSWCLQKHRWDFTDVSVSVPRLACEVLRLDGFIHMIGLRVTTPAYIRSGEGTNANTCRHSGWGRCLLSHKYITGWMLQYLWVTVLQQHQLQGQFTHSSAPLHRAVHPTWHLFQRSSTPSCWRFPDPGGKRAALERRRERKVLRGYDGTECQSVNQPWLQISFTHPGGNMGGLRCTDLPPAESWMHDRERGASAVRAVGAGSPSAAHQWCKSRAHCWNPTL